MPAIVKAAATKPTPLTKLGLAYVVEDDCVKVTGINEGGLLSSTDLKKGHEIITINGTYVEGLSRDAVNTILASIKTEIVITARPQPFKAGWISRTIDEVRKYPNDPSKTYTVPKVVHDVNYSRDTLPEILEVAGVPIYKWRKIHDAIRSEMAPATEMSDGMDEVFQNEMGNYTKKQMIKGGGWQGPGQESHHEKKMFHMTHQCAALTNSANLVATDVSARANVLLAPHGVMCALDLRPTALPKYSTKQQGPGHEVNKPYGLKFMSVE